jgi:hypothetical protein
MESGLRARKRLELLLLRLDRDDGRSANDVSPLGVANFFPCAEGRHGVRLALDHLPLEGSHDFDLAVVDHLLLVPR